MPHLGNLASAMKSFVCGAIGRPVLRSSFAAALIAFALVADSVANDERAPAQPGGGSLATSPFALGPVPSEVRETFGLAPFYQKCVIVGGLPKDSGPDGLCAKIVKGDEVRANLMENDGNNGVRVQRIVRRN